MNASTKLFFNFIVLISFCLMGSTAEARLAFAGDPAWNVREKINRKLGYGFATMPMGSYKPLGGYPGLDIGFDYHHIDLADLNALNYVTGNSAIDFIAPTISKGLYYDIDFKFSASFIPQNTDLQFFSGLIRWKFYENPTWFRLTAEAYLSGVTVITDVIPGSTSTATKSSYAVYGSGYGVVASRSFGRFEAFAGVGLARSISHFIVSEKKLNQDDTDTRITSGGGYDFGSGKITGGIDQIDQTKLFVQVQFTLN